MYLFKLEQQIIFLPFLNLIKSSSLEKSDFKKLFGELQGEKLKTSPQSFSKDHENIEWLKFKQYLLIRKFSDEEVLSNQFIEEAVYTFSQMLPFFDYFSDILTTDENGTPLPGY